MPPPIKFSIGCAIGITAVAVFLGGVQRVGNIAELLVPAAASGYIILSIGALINNVQEIPEALMQIFTGALKPGAVTSGVVGSALVVLRIGAARGVFTNEAGMGTAAIAHSSADVTEPIEQGFMGIIEVFLDTLVICTLTALVILTSGIEIPYGTDQGAALTTAAFAVTYGSQVSILLSIFLIIFAIATIFGWGYYGMECAGYLFGHCGVKTYIMLQLPIAGFAALLETGIVWQLAELMNGLMALPNLLTIAMLSRTVVSRTQQFIPAKHRILASDKNPLEGNRWHHTHRHEHGSPESFHH